MKGEFCLNEIDERNKYAEAHYGVMEQYHGELEEYLFETIALANENKYFQGLCDANRILALYYTIKSKVPEAKHALDMAQSIFDENMLNEEANLLLYNTYVVYYFDAVSDMEKAAEYCKMGIEKAEKYANKKVLARIKANFAVINLELKHYGVALSLLLNTLEYYESNSEENNRMYCYNNIAETYYALNNIAKAREYYEKALEMASLVNEIAIIHDASLGLAKVYLAMEQGEKSVRILENAIHTLAKYQNERLIVEAELALVDIFYQLEEYQKAYTELMLIESKSFAFDKVKDEINFYDMKAKVAEKIKDYELAYHSISKKHDLMQRNNENSSNSIITELLENEYRKTIKRLETIAEIGRELTTLNQLDDVVLDVAQKLKELLRLDCIGIGELNDHEIAYNHFYDEGVKLKPHIKSLDDEQSIAVWCIKNKKEVLINDIRSEYHAYVKYVDFFGNNNVSLNDPKGKIAQSVMYAPLLIKENVVGVFTIQSFEKDAYSSEEFEIFKIISSYVAIALQNINQSKALKELSIRDTLTGLLNRRGFTETYDNVVIKRAYQVRTLALIMLDLDFFKQVNDTYGHLVGDEVLLHIGKFLKSMNKEHELTARLGGEEFALFVINETREKVNEIAEYIRTQIEQIIILFQRTEISVTTSVGVGYMESQYALGYKDLYYKADSALYQAKDLGRNRVCWYEDELR